MRVRIGALVFGCSLALGCENTLPEGELPADLAGAATGEDKVIVGQVNWFDVGLLDDDSPERQNSRAVGYVSIPARGTRCTGFLINDNVVMTNEHCISSQAQANGATVSFRYETGVPFADRATFNCSTFLGDSANLDYALIQCSGNPGQTFGSVTLEDRDNVETGHPAYVIHQNCDYFSVAGCAPTKKYSPGQVTGRQGDIRHNADTLGGSSGSPLFSEDSHAVFGLHHVGLGNNGNGRGFANTAVPMGRILDDLAARFSGLTLGGQAPTAPPPAPAGDALEPNDTVATATPLSFPAAFNDLSITSEDIDAFTFDVTAPGTFSALISFVDDDGDIDVQLQREGDDAPLATAETNTDDEVVTEALTPGTYRLVVYGWNGATNVYSLAASFTPDQPVAPPPAPADPGDTVATSLLVNVPFTGDFAIEDGADRDLFRFNHTGAVTVQIDFSHAAGDLDLYVYNASGQRVGSSTSVSDNETVSITANQGGFIQVIGYQGATGAYTLVVQ